MLRTRLVPAMCLAVYLMLAGVHACAQRFQFESFDQRKGLKNLNVRSILQDRTGVLWLGTESGLFLYAGYHFEQVAVPQVSGAVFITGLVEDGRGRIWYSTPDALGYFDGRIARQVTAPDGEFNFELANRLAVDPDHPDRIYFVSRHTLYSVESEAGKQPRVSPVLTAKQIADYPELNKISGLAALPGDRLWLGCGSNLCLVHGSSVRSYSTQDGVPAEAWLQIFPDHNHTLWARSEHRLVRFSKQTGRFSDAGQGLSATVLSVREPQINEDPQGRVLINITAGLARYEQGAWTIFHGATDIPPYQPTALLVDRQGSIWIGLDGHGLCRWLGYNQWESLTAANGLSSNVVWGLTRGPKGDLWIATEDDLDRMQRGTNRIEPQKNEHGGPIQRVQALATPQDGHIWTGSDNGQIVDYDPVAGKARFVAQVGGVFQILPEGNKQLWACTQNGVFRLGINPSRTVEHIASPAPQGRVYAVVLDPSGNFWFLADSGLYRLSGSQWTHIHIPSDYHSVFSAQLGVAKDGTIWISGASPALMHLQITGDTARELQRFDVPALTSPTVYLMALDSRGRVWVGSDDGISIYDGQKWVHLDSDDGLVWNDIDSAAFYEDADGSIWIGTSGGAAHILHPGAFFQPEPLSVHLSHISIGGVEVAPGSTTTIAWSNLPLTANVSTLDFAHAGNVTFRYRVEGINEDWQDSPKHDLRYPPLAPGHYRLAVMAVDAQTGRQSVPTYVTFVITPPWWRTGFMYAAEVVCALLILMALWYWSLRRHLANERHLEELVRRRTNELELEKAELLRARAALEEQATHDSLTGLLNHGAILQALDHAIDRCLREGCTLGIVLADLDHFKRINDTYGHLTGDLILQEYGRRVQQCVRPYDQVGRYGGEEVLIILPGFDRETAMDRLLELHTAICCEPYDCKGQLISVTCSFGFTWLGSDVDTTGSMVERADQAMYAAKHLGRNRIEVCDPGEPEPLSLIQA